MKTDTTTCPRCGNPILGDNLHTCSPKFKTTNFANQIALVTMLEEIESTPDAFSNSALIGLCSRARKEIERLQAAVDMYEADYVRG